MKNIFKFLFSLFLVCATLLTFGQAPGKFNYQAVVRDALGPVVSSPVTVVFKLFNNAAGAGSVLYQESFSTTTNAYGIINLQVGTSPAFGNLSNLNWNAGPYYVDILMGGTSIYNGGNLAQLVSVPYSLFSSKSDSSNYATSALNSTYGGWNDYMIAEEQQNTGVPAGTNVVGWNTRNINTTTSSSGTAITRAGNQITLTQPGVYYIRATAPGFLVGGHKLTIKESSATTPLINGDFQYSSPAYDGFSVSKAEGTITILPSAPKTIILSHFTTFAYIEGLGSYNNIPSIQEVFSTIFILKIK